MPTTKWLARGGEEDAQIETFDYQDHVKPIVRVTDTAQSRPVPAAPEHPVHRRRATVPLEPLHRHADGWPGEQWREGRYRAGPDLHEHVCVHTRTPPLLLPYTTTAATTTTAPHAHPHLDPGPTFYQDAFEFIAECGGEAGAPIDEASALQVAIPVISALAHVHALGYAHRGKSRRESCFPSTD